MTYAQSFPAGGVDAMQGIFWQAGVRYYVANNLVLGDSTSVHRADTGAFAARLFAAGPSIQPDGQRRDTLIANLQFPNSAIIVSDRAGNRRTHLVTTNADGSLNVVTGSLVVPSGYDFRTTPPVAGAVSPTAAYIITTTDVFTATPADGSSQNLTLTHVAAHGLGGVGASGWYRDGLRLVTREDGQFWTFDTSTHAVSTYALKAPRNVLGLNVDPATGRLWGVTSTQVLEFEPPLVQRDAEQEEVSVRMRNRKTHRIIGNIDEKTIREMECDWRVREAGRGKLVLSYDALTTEQVLRLTGAVVDDETDCPPQFEDGGAEIEIYRRHEHGTDQFIGIIDSIDLVRYHSPDVTTLNIGSLINLFTIIGARTSGTGASECRVVAQVGDSCQIGYFGLHEAPPISNNVTVDRVDLEAIARARLRVEQNKRILDEVSFTRSSRIDEMIIHMSDPFSYLDRRYSTPAEGRETVQYDGRDAADFLYRMMQQELEFDTSTRGRGGRNKALSDVGDGGDGVAIRIDRGNGSDGSFNAEYPRTRLGRIAKDALAAGKLRYHYEIRPDEEVLRLSTRLLVDRTQGSGHPSPVLLTDSGEAYDPDTVLQGDIISRQIIHKDANIGSPTEQLQVFRRLSWDGAHGVRVTFGGGDLRLFELPVDAITDLSNDARVT